MLKEHHDERGEQQEEKHTYKLFNDEINKPRNSLKFDIARRDSTRNFLSSFMYKPMLKAHRWEWKKVK